jgi:hypothetical protein
MAAVLLYLRSALGDTRTSLITTTGGAVLPKVIWACLIGPATCLNFSLFTGPLTGVRQTNPLFLLITLATIGAVLLILRWRKSAAENPQANRHVTGRYGFCLIAGLGALAFGYCLAFREFYYPPIQVIGRLSAVHMGAAFGWCLLLGLAVSWLQLVVPGAQRWIGRALLLYAALAINAGLVVQSVQYVASWRQQRAMWQQLVALRGNYKENGIIVIDPTGFDRVEANPIDIFLENQACDTLQNFIAFPPSWSAYPRVYGVSPAKVPWFIQQGLADLNPQGVRLHFPSWMPSSVWPILQSGNFYFFRVKNNILVPSDQPLDFGGIKLVPTLVQPGLPSTCRLTRAYEQVILHSF